MLKRTGKGGMAPFKGSGFVTGRTVNARREAEWSAPTYFDMTIYGLGPPFRGDKGLAQTHAVPCDSGLGYNTRFRPLSIMCCRMFLCIACQGARVALTAVLSALSATREHPCLCIEVCLYAIATGAAVYVVWSRRRSAVFVSWCRPTDEISGCSCSAWWCVLWDAEHLPSLDPVRIQPKAHATGQKSSRLYPPSSNFALEAVLRAVRAYVDAVPLCPRCPSPAPDFNPSLTRACIARVHTLLLHLSPTLQIPEYPEFVLTLNPFRP